MVGSVKQVAIRLKPEGGAEVVAEARKAEEALVGAANRSKTATDAAVAAADRQVQKLREVGAAAAMSARNTPVQANIDRLTGVSGGGNARADVAARTLYAADEQAARAAAAIRAEIDPLAAATDRYNAELREMAALQARGHLTAQEFARGQELAKNRLDATTAALGRNTNGLTRNQMASRLNLTRQAADVAVTASMGMNPAMIAMQQGPQIADALATSGLKASASVIALGGALAVAAGAVVAMGLAWHDAEGDYLALDRAATGMGRTARLTAGELQDLAREGARSANISVSAAEKQAAAYISTGRIGGDVTRELIGLSKDYAAFVGQDMAEATESLSKAMLDPAAAAKQWNREFGLLDQATTKHIETLQKHGDISKAQAILAGELSDAVAGQAAKVDELTSAWQALGRMVSNTWKGLGEALLRTREEEVRALQVGMQAQHDTPTGRANRERMAARLRVLNTKSAIEEMMSSGVAEEAAANQAAQLAADGADRPKRGRSDRSAEREARERLQRARREKDRFDELQMAEARAAEDADRILALEDQEALTRRLRELEDAEVPKAKARARAEAEQAQLLAARDVSMNRQAAVLERTHGIEIERLLGNEAFVANLERQAALQDRIKAYEATSLESDKARSEAAADMLELAEARAEVMRRDVADAARTHALELARLSGSERLTRQLEIQERIQSRAREIEGREKLNRGAGEGRAAGEVAAEEHARMIGQGRDWAENLAVSIKRAGIRNALADELNDAGERFVRNLARGLWDIDWGKMFGGAGGGSGGLGGLLGGVLSLFGPVGKNAAGTDWWRGGLSWVGEGGAELVNLPRGAQVIDADRSRRMAAMGGGAGGQAPVQHNHYYLQGAVTTNELMDRIERGDRQAAMSGANRGASVAVSTVHETAPSVQHSERMMRD